MLPLINGSLPDVSEVVQRLEAALQRAPAVAEPARTSTFSTFLWGAIVAGLVALFVWYRFEATLHRAGALNKQRQAAEALSRMDPQQLREILTNIDLPAWATSPDFERVKWLNHLLEQIYPYAARMAHTWAAENMNALLQENKPGFVRSMNMSRFTLGNTPPRITGIKVFDEEDVAGKDEAIIDIDVSWASDIEMRLSVQPVPKAKIPVVEKFVVIDRALNALTSLVMVKASAERLTVNGRVRVMLRPLMSALPVVGSVQVALTEIPKFSFDLRLYGGDVSVLPGLEGWLYSLIKDNVFRAYTLPERYVVPLISEDQLAAQRPRGMLEVEVVEADNVPRMDWLSLSDPYVHLFNRAGRQVKTQVLQDSKAPKWGETFRLLVHYPDTQTLTAVLMDFDELSADDEIGRVEKKISELPPGELVDEWYDVLPPQHEHKRREKRRCSAKQGKEAAPGAAQSGKTGRSLASTGRRMGGKKPCRLHLRCRYVEFPREMEGAAQAHLEHGGGEAGRQAALERMSPSMRRVMGGGALWVRPKAASDLDLSQKSWIAGGWKHNVKVKVRFAGEVKSTPGKAGRRHVYSYDDQLEFVVDGNEAVQAGRITIEVWDVHWRNVCLGWADVPLSEVQRDHRFSETLDLQGVARGRVEVQCEWLGLMDAQAGLR